MTSMKDDNAQSNPQWVQWARDAIWQRDGIEAVKPRGEQSASTLTVREHYAVAALQGLLAGNQRKGVLGFDRTDAELVYTAVELADALLRALSPELPELTPDNFDLIVEEAERKADALA